MEKNKRKYLICLKNFSKGKVQKDLRTPLFKLPKPPKQHKQTEEPKSENNLSKKGKKIQLDEYPKKEESGLRNTDTPENQTGIRSIQTTKGTNFDAREPRERERESINVGQNLGRSQSIINREGSKGVLAAIA